MRDRILGNSKIKASPIGMGCMGITLTASELAQIDELLDGLDLKVFGGHAVQ